MTAELIKVGQAALLAPGRLALLSGVGSVIVPPPPPPPPPPSPTVPGPITSIAFVPRTLTTAAANDFGVGNAHAIGGTGPYTYALTGSTGVYRIDRRTGQVALTYHGHPTAGMNSITIQATGGDGSTFSQSFSFPVGNGPVVLFSDDTMRDNVPPGTQSIQYEVYGLSGTPAVSLSDPSGTFKLGPYSTIVPTNGSAAPALGSYPIAVTASDGSASVITALTLQMVHEAPATAIYFAPVAFNSLTPAGTPLGTAMAADADNIYTWSLSDDAGGKYAIGSNSGLVSIAPGAVLTVGTDAITIVQADLSTTYSQTFSLSVPQGVILPAANMAMVVSTTLVNFVPNSSVVRPVGTPSVTGLTGAQFWTITQNNVCPNDALPLIGPDGRYAHGHDRYEIDASTGTVTTRAQLSAQTDTLVLSVTDGIHICTASFDVVVAAVVGPTLYVGEGMVAAHGATLAGGVQGFEHWMDLNMLLQSANPPYAGATVIVMPHADPNYYANDCGNDQDPRYPNHDAVRFGLHVPLTIMGAPGGPRPRWGGIVGAPRGGTDQYGHGLINISDGDVTIKHMEFSDIHANSYAEGTQPRNSSAVGCAIRHNGNIWGNLTVDDCYMHDIDQGIETGDNPGTITITNTEIVNGGGTYVSAGATHNLYIGGNWKLVMDNVLSWRATNGHTLKSRAGNGVITRSRFYDSEHGSASKQVDICDGGLYLLDHCVFQKGAMSQNPYCIGFCAEMNHGYPQNVLTVSNSTLINNVPGVLNPVGLALYTRQSPISGEYSQIISTGNSYIGFSQVGSTNTAVVVSTDVNPNCTGRTAGSTITETGAVQLGAQPALDFTAPGTAGGHARPGPFYFPWDGNLQNGQAEWAYSYGVQMDFGSDDIHIPHTSGLGAFVATCQADGCSWYQGATPQPDVRVQPFTAGTVYSISQTAATYLGFRYAVAPVGRYAIDPSTGVLTVGQALSAGVDNIVVRATAPGGIICEYMAYIVKD